MNALAHCVEAVWSPRARPRPRRSPSPVPDGSPPRCPLVVDDPDDLAVRAAMLEGAVLGGRCLQNASMGVHHGLSQLVGGRTGIAHGLANAVLLPHAIRFNAEAVPDAVRRARRGPRRPTTPPAPSPTLVARLGLPTQLGDCGVTLEDVDAVARLAPGNRNVVNNPRPVGGRRGARQILTAAY